jgi:hypothetical protein
MDRWTEWVVAFVFAAAIVALVAFARGEPGRNDVPVTAVAAVTVSS